MRRDHLETDDTIAGNSGAVACDRRGLSARRSAAPYLTLRHPWPPDLPSPSLPPQGERGGQSGGLPLGAKTGPTRRPRGTPSHGEHVVDATAVQNVGDCPERRGPCALELPG